MVKAAHHMKIGKSSCEIQWRESGTKLITFLSSYTVSFVTFAVHEGQQALGGGPMFLNMSCFFVLRLPYLSTMVCQVERTNIRA